MREDNLVSIITPTYNSAEFIEDTINSIIMQEYENWELLVTDDCSTDDTWEILQDYCRLDDRIKVFRNKGNHGAGITRNISIMHASGRFIAFCDSDDCWKPDKLTKQIRFMIRNELALCYSGYDVVNEKNEYQGEVKALKMVDYKTMLRNNYIGCLTAVYDIARLGKVYMPECRKRQDWGLWLAILKRIPCAMGIQESLAVYRRRNNSISSGKIALLKHNWKIYREIESFSTARSCMLMTIFMYHYFKKELPQQLNLFQFLNQDHKAISQNRRVTWLKPVRPAGWKIEKTVVNREKSWNT